MKQESERARARTHARERGGAREGEEEQERERSEEGDVEAVRGELCEGPRADEARQQHSQRVASVQHRHRPQRHQHVQRLQHLVGTASRER
eukprot:1943204-Rhodomonas_salina.1